MPSNIGSRAETIAPADVCLASRRRQSEVYRSCARTPPCAESMGIETRNVAPAPHFEFLFPSIQHTEEYEHMTYKLLIVDDEMPNIRLLERLFQHDYQCLTASSGEDAMSLLDQHEVAVIITDQRMPQMTGIELLKRSADRRPHMVRILLTGYTDLDALVEAVNCGLVYMYVSKPWTNDDLKVRVSRAVEHYETNKQQHSLAANNKRLESRLNEMKVGLLRMAAGILQLQDPYLCLHAVRVSKYAERSEERRVGKECRSRW